MYVFYKASGESWGIGWLDKELGIIYKCASDDIYIIKDEPHLIVGDPVEFPEKYK